MNATIKPAPRAIDPSIFKFVLALAVVSVLVEITDQFNHAAAWGLVLIIVLGLLLNNPNAISAINSGGQFLQRGVR